VPGERGVGGEDRRGRRANRRTRPHDRPRADGSRVRAAVGRGFAAQKNFGLARGAAADWIPLASTRTSRSSSAELREEIPRVLARTPPRRGLPVPRATSSGDAGCATVPLWPDRQLRLFHARPGTLRRARGPRVGGGRRGASVGSGHLEPPSSTATCRTFLARADRYSTLAPPRSWREAARRIGVSDLALAPLGRFLGDVRARAAASSTETRLSFWRVLYALLCARPLPLKVMERRNRPPLMANRRRSACCRACDRAARLHLGNYLGALANWVQAPGSLRLLLLRRRLARAARPT
jgi:hypothetical protein